MSGAEEQTTEEVPAEDPVLAEEEADAEDEATDAAEEAAAEEAADEPQETELDRALRERGEYLELAQRTQADFENFRKRVAQQTSDAERRGRASLARELAPSLDNLERAMLSAGVEVGARAEVGDGGPPSEEVSGRRALAEGVALVYRELQGTLERAGVIAFDPIGERFDPSMHEAVTSRPAEDGAESGVVIETLARGYRVGDEVVRAAQVVVSE